jgi:hypothetical protein
LPDFENASPLIPATKITTAIIPSPIRTPLPAVDAVSIRDLA